MKKIILLSLLSLFLGFTKVSGEQYPWAVTDDGKYFAYVTYKSVQIKKMFDLKAPEEYVSVKCKEESKPEAICFAPDNETLYMVLTCDKYCTYNIKTKKIAYYDGPRSDVGVKVNKVQKYFLMTRMLPYWKLDITTGKVEQAVNIPSAPNEWLTPVVDNSGNFFCVVSNKKTTIDVYDFNTNELLYVFKIPKEDVGMFRKVYFNKESFCQVFFDEGKVRIKGNLYNRLLQTYSRIDSEYKLIDDETYAESKADTEKKQAIMGDSIIKVAHNIGYKTKGLTGIHRVTKDTIYTFYFISSATDYSVADNLLDHYVYFDHRSKVMVCSKIVTTYGSSSLEYTFHDLSHHKNKIYERKKVYYFVDEKCTACNGKGIEANTGHSEMCSNCKGSGTSSTDCKTCGGLGVFKETVKISEEKVDITKPRTDGTTYKTTYTSVKCYQCHGSGKSCNVCEGRGKKTNYAPCKKCDGKKTVSVQKYRMD